MLSCIRKYFNCSKTDFDIYDNDLQEKLIPFRQSIEDILHTKSREFFVRRQNEESLLEKCHTAFHEIFTPIQQRAPKTARGKRREVIPETIKKLLQFMQSQDVDIDELALNFNLDPDRIREIKDNNDEDLSQRKLLVKKLVLMIEEIFSTRLQDKTKYDFLSALYSELSMLIQTELLIENLDDFIAKIDSDLSLNEFENLQREYFISPSLVQQIRFQIQKLSLEKRKATIISFLISSISISKLPTNVRNAVMQSLLEKDLKEIKNFYEHFTRHFIYLISSQYNLSDIELRYYLTFFGMTRSDYTDAQNLVLDDLSQAELDIQIAEYLRTKIQENNNMPLELKNEISNNLENSLDKLYSIAYNVEELPSLVDRIISHQSFDDAFRQLAENYTLTETECEAIRQSISLFKGQLRKLKAIDSLYDRINDNYQSMSPYEHEIYLSELESLANEDFSSLINAINSNKPFNKFRQLAKNFMLTQSDCEAIRQSISSFPRQLQKLHVINSMYEIIYFNDCMSFDDKNIYLSKFESLAFKDEDIESIKEDAEELIDLIKRAPELIKKDDGTKRLASDSYSIAEKHLVRRFGLNLEDLAFSVRSEKSLSENIDSVMDLVNRGDFRLEIQKIIRINILETKRIQIVDASSH